MGKKLLLPILLFILFADSAHSQVELKQNTLFSEAIRLNIKKYTRNSQRAYAYQDFDRAEFLYDSLIDNVVKGSYLDNFHVRKISGRKIELYKYKKPIFLITYSSWCVPAEGEIPALNKVASKYFKDIDFVVLFWDTKTNARKTAKKYSRKINLIYVDEKDNTNNYIVGRMKHSLGLPTSFIIDKDKRIIAVRRGVEQFYRKTNLGSPDSIYKYFLKGTSLLTKLREEDKNFLNSRETD